MKLKNKTEIVRVKKDRDYTVINNTCLRDDRLSWKAKGIMAYILTLPDDWNIYLEEVMKHAPDGEKAFRSGLKELKELGYVERVQIRCEETKRIIGWQTIVNEKPQTLDNTLLAQKLHVGNLHVEKLHVGNEGLLSTEDTNYLSKQSTDKTSLPNGVAEVEKHLKTLPNLPGFRSLTAKRKSAINARLNEYGYETVIEMLDKVNETQFFIENKSSNWYTIDWIFNPNNFIKIVEGKYFNNNSYSNKPKQVSLTDDSALSWMNE